MTEQRKLTKEINFDDCDIHEHKNSIEKTFKKATFISLRTIALNKSNKNDPKKRFSNDQIDFPTIFLKAEVDVKCKSPTQVQNATMYAFNLDCL